MDVETLLARAEIHDTLMRYLRGADRKKPELMRAAFHDDATVDYSPFYEGDLDGFIEYAAGPEALGGFDITMHFCGNLLIEVDGDVARSEMYAIAHHTVKPEHEWAGALVLSYMRYLDRFERRDGRWAVARRVIAYDWLRKDTFGGFLDLPPDRVGDNVVAP